MGSAMLIKTVEMQTRCLIPKVVFNVDNDLVPNSRCDVRYWPLPVDANGWARKAIGLGSHPANIEVVSHNISDGRRDQEEEGYHDRSCCMRCHVVARQ